MTGAAENADLRVASHRSRQTNASVPPPPSDIDRLKCHLPRYTLGEEIGRGATGVVYLARHEPLQRLVAVKHLSPALTADYGTRERFMIEAHVLAALSHPHIVQVFDYVGQDDLAVLIMEYLPGGTAWDLFCNEGVTQSEAVAFALAACSATSSAHRMGVYHRDIKPENLMIDEAGTIKVADFGLAYVVSGEMTPATPDGQVFGTPAYMAPEQAEGGELGVQTDVYAIGTMLYEMLSGSLPFPGLSTITKVLSARLRDEATDLRTVAPEVPEAIADVVMKSLARDRHDRHASAEAFGVELGIAAASSWGPQWLHEVPYQVEGSPRILAAAQTLRLQRGSLGVPGDSDTRRFAQRVVSDPDHSERVTKAAQPREHRRVRAAANVGELVDIADVQAVLRRPIVWRAGALAASIIAVVLLLSGLGATSAPLPAGQSDVVVAEQAAEEGRSVQVDFREPIEVNAGSNVAFDRAELDLSIFGITVRTLTADSADGSQAAFEDRLSGWLFAGSMGGELRLVGDGTTRFESKLAVRGSNPPLFTAAGIGVLLFLLVGLNRLDWQIRAMAAQRPSAHNTGWLVAIGAWVGAVAAVATNVFVSNTHTLATLAATSIMFGLAAGCGGVAASLRPVRRSSDRRGFR